MLNRAMGNFLGALYRNRVRGRDRVHGLLSRLAGHRLQIVASNRYGVPLSMTPDDSIDRFVLENGFYESEVFDAIREKARARAVFWDVGANAGIHCVTLAKLAPDTSIVALEPSTREIARIQASAGAAGVHFEILPLGLSDCTAISSFYLRSDNSGRNSLIPKGDGSGYEKTTIALTTGDHLCFDLGFPIPHVVKIDVEGAEHQVLLGLAKILQHPDCRRIIIEGSADFADGTNQTAKLLTDAGFTVSALIRNEDSHHVLENFLADKVVA